MEKMNEDQKQIITYLKKAVKSGRRYFKSKHIAQEIGMTSKQVGLNLYRLKTLYTGLDISEWGQGSGITWKVQTA